MSSQAIDIAGLYASEQGRLKKFVMRLVRNHTAAEDLVQDAFVNLLRGTEASKIDNSRSYLTQTARNLAIDHLRRERHRSQYSGQLEADALPVCDQPLADAVLQGRQELAALRRVIDKLPTKCRVVFLLSREHGLTMKQIAESLGISEKTVEKHLMRAMVDCRRELRAFGRNI